jgi:MFS family permease
MRQRIFLGWYQVLVAFLIQAMGSGALYYSYSVLVVPFSEAFEPSRMVLMLGITAMTLLSGIISPWLGAAIDRHSVRNLICCGVMAMALGFFSLSLVTAIWQMPLIYPVMMSWGAVLLGPLSASTLLSRWFVRRRGLAIGIAAMGTSLGGFLFPPMIQWLVDAFEWRTAFQLLGLFILLVTLPVVWLLTVDRPGDRNLKPDGIEDFDEHTNEVPVSAFSSTTDVLKNRSFWLIALVMSVMFGVFTATMANLVPFALDLGITPDRGALLLSNMAVMAVPGTLLFGYLADRVDVRLVLGLVIVTIVSGLASLSDEPAYTRMVAGSVLIGLGGGGMLPVWGAMLGRIFGAWNYGRVMGLMNPVIMPFNLLTPPFAGWVQDVSGSYHWAFMVFAGLMLISLFALPFVEKRAETTRPV